MTCIVGIAENGNTYIGADSFCSNLHGGYILATPKVFRVGDFLMASAGTLRDLQLLEHTFSPPKQYRDQGIMEFMCTSFVSAVRTLVDMAGALVVEDGQEGMMSEFVIGYDGQLFKIQSDFSVLHVAEPYIASGSGWSFAVGSLHSTVGLPPTDRIAKALEAAAYYDPFVRPPFTLMSDCDVNPKIV